MKKEQSIRNAFEFLSQYASTGTPFTAEQLAKASGWTIQNTKTNLAKRLTDVVKHSGGKIIAKPELLRVRYQDFQDLFRQKQRLFTDYIFVVTPQVLIYEFFMPLSREDRLREALDNLFFLDTVRQRVVEIGGDAIRDRLAACRREKSEIARSGHLHQVLTFIWLKSGSNRGVSGALGLLFLAGDALKRPLNGRTAHAAVSD